ncbi:uncharacterized protein LOC106641266 isoform X2 [Copidosoma floridanum]|nr:uncharacterized protein LOC106641266 isoform X2 [Copidosoma floridanum]XP_014211116.1 uncharacterized protein LOC106641266 isoform X2 [Copidosoma floridanum]
MIKLILLCLCLTVAKHSVVEASIIVKEVQAGDLVELPCLSNDDHHRFMFWQLTDHSHVISPGNPVDEQKYKYEVLTGKLFIRAVSTAEAGFYSCISRGVENSATININTVELIVKKEVQVESSFETNLLRGMAVATVIVVGIAVALLVIILRRQRNHRFFDVMEESRENSPAKYVGTIQSAPVTPAPRTLEAEGIDNMGLDVDFPRVFQQMQDRPM